jgi:rhomboid family GlyGly-CTERM serine protease
MQSSTALQLIRRDTLWVPCLILALMIALHFYPIPLSSVDYNYDQLFAEPWRLLSAHFVHLHFTHMLSNALMFALISFLFRAYIAGRVLLNVVLFSAVFAALVPWLVGQQTSFVGLSGVLHGILAFAAVIMLQRGNRWGIAVLVGLGIKVLLDLVLDRNAPWLGAEIAAYAHLGGLLGGLIAIPGTRKRPGDILKKPAD